MSDVGALAILASYDNAGPASERAIVEAERALGVSFPAEYRRFLSHFGATNGGGFYLAGCSDESENQPPYWSSVVEATLRLRRVGSIPREYLLLSDNGNDHSFLLCASSTAEVPEGAVVVLGPGADHVVIAESFVAFALLLANGTAPYNE